MKLTMDGQDYTHAVDSHEALTIERTLGGPAVCRAVLCLPADGSVAAPARLSTLVVTAEDGTVLFSGVVTAAPMPDYAGMVTEGPQYRLSVQASEVTQSACTVTPENGATGWTAGEAKAATDISALGVAVHTLRDGEGTLRQTPPPAGSTTLALTQDVTVCGEHEPATYVTEFFSGDGVANQFQLSEPPYFPPAGEEKVLVELFDRPALDARIWAGACDTHFALGGGGLKMQGGAGVEGATVLALRQTVEMGGSLLLEAGGVTLGLASTGLLAGFFADEAITSAAVAAFQVKAAQGTGAVSLQAFFGGVAAGTPFAVDADSAYTLRLRMYCDEPLRTLADWSTFNDTGLVTEKYEAAQCGGRVLFELEPCVNGVFGMPVVLYEGAMSGIPATCMLVAAGSVNLHGAMRSLRLTNQGSVWVTSTLVNGSTVTRRTGTLADGGDCTVNRGGRLMFNTGLVPQQGERIAVRYRTSCRSVGRVAGAGSAVNWIGTAKRPKARSSADCRNAAAALLVRAGSVSALWSGTWKTTRTQLEVDAQPGDAVQFAAVPGKAVVRTVRMKARMTVPEVMDVELEFSNEWAARLAMETSDGVPADVWLPVVANAKFASNLPSLAATLSGNTLVLNMGCAAPAGGGFEVRRRDGIFAPGNDAELVARGAQAQFSLARQAASERYFVRMFDGAVPPNYSEFASAVFLNVPLA